MSHTLHTSPIQHLQPWLAFQRPYVRDLAYAIACPPILQHWPHTLPHPDIHLPDTAFWHAQFVRYLPRLNALEKDPRPLNQFLGNHLTNFRLGFRFEALILFWLLDSHYHDYDVIAHNIQLFSPDPSEHNEQPQARHTPTAHRKTLGELDLLLRNTVSGEIEHWELTMKFLLGEAPYEPANWKGLKGSDNLEKKIIHTQQKSFRFTSVAVDGKTYHIDKRVAVFKGRFYYPVGATTDALPDWLNPHLPLCQWRSSLPDNVDIQHWRQGKRVEWITKRNFYDAFALGLHPKQQKKDNNTDLTRRTPLTWETGLYFDMSQPLHNQHVMLRLQPNDSST